MVLIQMLLPLVSVAPAGRGARDDAINTTRLELVAAFGGVTAYLQSPAQGVWTGDGGQQERDDVVMVEVVAEAFDRDWWRQFTRRLADRFGQDAMHVRAMPIELLDERGA